MSQSFTALSYVKPIPGFTRGQVTIKGTLRVVRGGSRSPLTENPIGRVRIHWKLNNNSFIL